jgi:hypothetical protein
MSLRTRTPVPSFLPRQDLAAVYDGTYAIRLMSSDAAQSAANATRLTDVMDEMRAFDESTGRDE